MLRKCCCDKEYLIKFEAEVQKLNIESSKQFLKQNAFLTSWRFLRYDKLEQVEFKLEKNIGI